MIETYQADVAEGYFYIGNHIQHFFSHHQDLDSFAISFNFPRPSICNCDQFSWVFRDYLGNCAPSGVNLFMPTGLWVLGCDDCIGLHWYTQIFYRKFGSQYMRRCFYPDIAGQQGLALEIIYEVKDYGLGPILTRWIVCSDDRHAIFTMLRTG